MAYIARVGCVVCTDEGLDGSVLHELPDALGVAGGDAQESASGGL
jgi:hypothetical protein